VGDWWNQPMRRESGEESDDSGSSAGGLGAATCPWCSAAAAPAANHCPSCGAIMAQRESLGGLVIPGVTDVDPRIRQPSLTGSLLGTQARMNALGAVGHAGGTPAKLATAAAILAKDSIGSMFKPGTNPEEVGRPSQAALEMAGRLSSSGQNSPVSTGDDHVADATASDEPA
jgi:hypothetical protein